MVFDFIKTGFASIELDDDIDLPQRSCSRVRLTDLTPKFEVDVSPMFQGLLTGRKRGLLDAPIHYFVDAQHLLRTWTFRKIAGDEFKVGYDIAHHHVRLR